MFVDKLTSVALAFKVDESRTASGPSVLIRCRSSIFGLEVESGVAAAVSDSCRLSTKFRSRGSVLFRALGSSSLRDAISALLWTLTTLATLDISPRSSWRTPSNL